MFDYINSLIPCNHLFSINLVQDLQDLFVMRSDVHAIQSKSGVWRKVDLPLTIKDLDDHLNGKKTVGVYQAIGDKAKWAVFDIDNHNGENNNSLQDTEKLVLFLQDNDIPYMVEASGSPDSYHVWLFFMDGTNLSNIYNFTRIIAERSGFKGEVFPKQRSIRYGGYGNLVKLPLGINHRSGNWSKLAIGSKVDSLIKLDDVPDQKKPSKKPLESIVRPNDLFYCQKAILENKTALGGSEGHFMRVALAANAIKSGYKNEEIIKMFEHQIDFSYEYTRSQIIYIREKKYYCSCQWLKSRCGGLVSKYCEKCEKEK